MEGNPVYELRNFLFCRNEEKQINGELLVESEPYDIIFLETVPVDYWFFGCIYKGKPMLLEQRIELTAEGSIIDETIRELPPFICSELGEKVNIFNESGV